MSNPFAGIITPDHKATFKYMIDAILENSALTVPCQLIYGNTNPTTCENCVFDPITGRSAGLYLDGGPIQFEDHQICPWCHGEGVKTVEATESGIYMGVLWNYKDWVFFDPSTRSPAGTVQTMSSMSLYPKLKQAKSIVFNTDLETYAHHRFMRDSEPTPAGFGEDAYIFTFWKRSA